MWATTSLEPSEAGGAEVAEGAIEEAEAVDGASFELGLGLADDTIMDEDAVAEVETASDVEDKASTEEEVTDGALVEVEAGALVDAASIDEVADADDAAVSIIVVKGTASSRMRSACR
jgi:hypothetical protein